MVKPIVVCHLGLFVLMFLISFVSFSHAGVLVYSTFIGGNNADNVYDLAVDAAGNIYLTGVTGSPNFPTTSGTIDTTLGGTADVFITKLNPNGTALIYSTLIGGAGTEQGSGIAVDGSQNVYIGGYTNSSADFPTTPGAYDRSFNDPYYTDNFIFKLDNTGTNLVYSTFIGGYGFDNVMDLAIDVGLNAYIVGHTDSLDYPCVPGSYDTSYNGDNDDAFVTKLNGDGSALLYSTYLGGSSYDLGFSIAVDDSGNAYITGYTNSNNFPTSATAFDSTFNGGYADVFVTKLNNTGSGLEYSTYLGGSYYDWGYGIALDNSDNAYIIGVTRSSTSFPVTTNAISTSYRGGLSDAFVSKLSSDGSQLMYSTYLGGSGEESGSAIAVNPSTGEAYLTGYTKTTADYPSKYHDFPITPNAFDTSYNGSDDVYLCKLSSGGNQLEYSTYLGGGALDEPYGIAIDNSDNVYLTGWTNSSADFPISPGAFDRIFNGGQNDVFVTKLALKWFNNYGSFANANDTVYWYYEKYGDGTAPGTLSWVTGYNGQSGVLKLRQNEGEKGKITQIFSVASSGWYTAVAKVASDISNITKQQKIYLYLQELNTDTAIVATGNLVVQPGNSGLIGAGIWRQLQISFYAQETLLGIQVVGINPTTSAVTGSIYLDDIWVYAGAAVPSDPVILTNPSFDSGTAGWLVQLYADGSGPGAWSGVGSWSGHTGVVEGNQTGGEKGKLSQTFGIAESGINMTGSVWVYSGAASVSNSQKVYLYLYSYTSDYSKVIESGNAILQAGKWTPGEWRQLQFSYIPFSVYNAVQVVGINQLGKPTQSIYFDEVQINQ